LIPTFRRSENLDFGAVHHFHQFAFLRLSKRLATRVSVDASLFRQSHSNLIPNFRRSENLHFTPVRHFHQFAFLLLSKHFVVFVSKCVALFRR
jgi:hypothetical protein